MPPPPRRTRAGGCLGGLSVCGHPLPGLRPPCIPPDRFPIRRLHRLPAGRYRPVPAPPTPGERSILLQINRQDLPPASHKTLGRWISPRLFPATRFPPFRHPGPPVPFLPPPTCPCRLPQQHRPIRGICLLPSRQP